MNAKRDISGSGAGETGGREGLSQDEAAFVYQLESGKAF